LSLVSLFFPYPLFIFKNNLPFLNQITLLDLAGISALLILFYITISVIVRNFIYVEQFEKEYQAETIWEYLRKISLVKKRMYLDKFLNNLTQKK